MIHLDNLIGLYKKEVARPRKLPIKEEEMKTNFLKLSRHHQEQQNGGSSANVSWKRDKD